MWRATIHIWSYAAQDWSEHVHLNFIPDLLWKIHFFIFHLLILMYNTCISCAKNKHCPFKDLESHSPGDFAHPTLLLKIKSVEAVLHKKKSYQFINELFPAEWLPIIKTVIFFLGARRERPKPSAIFTIPIINKLNMLCETGNLL